MQTIHILNGDFLAEQLKQTDINPDFIICRECLIVGDVDAESLKDFWALRSQFISKAYDFSIEDYYDTTVREFEKIQHLADGSDVALWFENDLFCQVNMWFVLYLLSDHPNIRLSRVFPKPKNAIDIWKGFGEADAASLETFYHDRVAFKEEDVDLGKKLWLAFQKSNFEELTELSKIHSRCFEYLNEVVEAHIDRFPKDGSLGRPEKVVKDIIQNKSKIFAEVFSEFSLREGIYGFGDSQLKSIFDKII